MVSTTQADEQLAQDIIDGYLYEARQAGKQVDWMAVRDDLACAGMSEDLAETLIRETQERSDA